MLKTVINGSTVWYKLDCDTLPQENRERRKEIFFFVGVGETDSKHEQVCVPVCVCKRHTCLALRSNTTYCWHWSSLLFLIVQKCRTRFSLCSNSFRMSEQNTHTQMTFSQCTKTKLWLQIPDHFHSPQGPCKAYLHKQWYSGRRTSRTVCYWLARHSMHLQKHTEGLVRCWHP